ncbi:MAG: hypothetical protein ABIU05_05320 [Nitrospirales bacterium]
MGNVVAIEQEKPVKKARARKYSLFAEDQKAHYLLRGVDEQGKAVYFFKVQITGLRDRIFGPYDSRSKAIVCFDVVLDAALESFCDAETNGRYGIMG